MSRKQQLIEKLTQIISDRLEDDASLNEGYMDSLRKNFIPIVLSVIGGTAALLSTPIGKSKVEKHKYEIIDKAVESGYEEEQAEEVLDTILSGDELSGRMSGIEKIKKRRNLVQQFARESFELDQLYDKKDAAIRRAKRSHINEFQQRQGTAYTEGDQPFVYKRDLEKFRSRLKEYTQLLLDNAAERRIAFQQLLNKHEQDLKDLEAIPVAYP